MPGPRPARKDNWRKPTSKRRRAPPPRPPPTQPRVTGPRAPGVLAAPLQRWPGHQPFVPVTTPVELLREALWVLSPEPRPPVFSGLGDSSRSEGSLGPLPASCSAPESLLSFLSPFSVSHRCGDHCLPQRPKLSGPCQSEHAPQPAKDPLFNTLGGYSELTCRGPWHRSWEWFAG